MIVRGAIFAIVGLLAAYGILVTVLPWDARRKLRHGATYLVGGLGAALALVPLVLLVTYLVRAGVPGLSLEFFTKTQAPLGEAGGGFLHAILGTIEIVALASAMGVPIGVLAGIYLAEVGRGWLAGAIRFLAEVLTGLPSIIAGILGYTLIVVRTGEFSALAGAIALAVLMVPVITRVTEEAIRLVPPSLREASFGLGIGQWRTVWHITLPSAKSAILTGIVLAIARVGGETAPLLFTAVGQSIVNFDPTKAMAALPLSIYANANQPFDVSKQLAVTGALVLVASIGLVNLLVRWLTVRSERMRGGA